MNKLLLFLLLGMPFIIMAQQNIDITGRISINTLNTSYNETSQIKPDSVADSSYAKSTLIPGLSQNLNMALFARTSTLDISLLGEISNNSWNRLDFGNQNTINRLSLNIRFANHEIVLGDFYENGSDIFIQSREMRGARLTLNFKNIWTRNSYLKIRSMYGLAQKKLDIGAHTIGVYKQYESSGLFNRTLGAASVSVGQDGVYDLGVHFLTAADDTTSISSSLNTGIKNKIYGVNGKLNLWKKHIQLFGDGFISKKDTVGAESTNDNSYKGGIDFRYSQFKAVVYYQRLGFNYFSAGYPFLLTDKKGLHVNTVYNFPRLFYVGFDGEQYRNNLDNDAAIPTTNTRLGELSVTTAIPRWPELTLVLGFRDDKSNTIVDENNEKTSTDKISRKIEGRFAQNFGSNRFSLSTIYLDLDDRSQIVGGDPLGTKQLIASMNFYTRPNNNFFISGGVVYSTLTLSDNKKNNNYFIYQSNRWDIIRNKLLFESNLNFTRNNAANGGDDDLLNKYWNISGLLSLEYFFNPNISFKMIGGINSRKMNYTVDEALLVLQKPDVDPTFFNGNESYNAVIYGAEINWIF